MHLRNWALTAGFTLAFVAGGLLLATMIQTAACSDTDPLMPRLAAVPNAARPYPWLVTGGQPDSCALSALAAAGVQDVYDLRAADEPRGFDERGMAQSLGLRYHAMPSRPADFNDEKFTAFRHHLLAHGPEHPMFIHCATGNRVGAVLLPWLVLDQGLSDDLALEMAKSVGLRDPGLTQQAWGYINLRHPGKLLR